MFDLLLWFIIILKKLKRPRRLRSQKVVGTEKVYILSLEDLLRVVFIDEERRNLKVVTAGGELTRNINH